MNIQELLGEEYKEGMTIDDINKILASKNFVDPTTLPPSVPKATFDKTASELATAKKKIGELESANLSDEEKIKKALEDAQVVKDEYNRKSVRLDVEKILVQGGLSEEDYKGVIDGLVSTDRDASVALANNLVVLLTGQKNAAADAVKAALKKQLTPPPKGSETEVTKETFDKMSVSEKMKFKSENPETYKELFGGN